MYLRLIHGFRFLLLWFQNLFLVLNNIFLINKTVEISRRKRRRRAIRKEENCYHKEQKEDYIIKMLNVVRNVNAYLRRNSFEDYNRENEKVKNVDCMIKYI